MLPASPAAPCRRGAPSDGGASCWGGIAGSRPSVGSAGGSGHGGRSGASGRRRAQGYQAAAAHDTWQRRRAHHAVRDAGERRGPCSSRGCPPWLQPAVHAECLLQATQQRLLAMQSCMRGDSPPPQPPPSNPPHHHPHHPHPLRALQEDFKPYARAMQGFAFRPERPDAATFVEQKWGYTGDSPGHWVELELSTVDGAAAGGGAGSGAGGDRATVFLGYLSRCSGSGPAEPAVSAASACPSAQPTFPACPPIKQAGTQRVACLCRPDVCAGIVHRKGRLPRLAAPEPWSPWTPTLCQPACSYDGMGQARVECVSGCKCAATAFDARWKQKVSLTQMHQFKAST